VDQRLLNRRFLGLLRLLGRLLRCLDGLLSNLRRLDGLLRCLGLLGWYLGLGFRSRCLSHAALSRIAVLFTDLGIVEEGTCHTRPVPGG